MKWYNNLSIKFKFMIVISFASFICTLIGLVSFALLQNNNQTQRIYDDVNLNSRLIGEYSVTAILFNDKAGAFDILKKIANVEFISEASLYDTTGTLYTSYSKYGNRNTNVFLERYQLKDTIFISNDIIHSIKPIFYENLKYGYIEILASTQPLVEMRKELLLMMSIILLIVVLLSIILANYLQKHLSNPLLILTKLTSDVIQTQDYTIRAKSMNNDETGNLIHGFNLMLEKIQSGIKEREKAEKQIISLNSELELRVQLRTNELSNALETLMVQNRQLMETQNALRMAKDIADNANKAKTEFIANISHEIRTPMNAIIGFSSLLLGRTDNPENHRFLTSIVKSGNTLLTLINDILDLSKIEAGQMDIIPDRVNLTLLAKEVCQLFSSKTLEKKLDFQLHIQDNFPDYLYLDEIRIRQILMNLLSNAIKFTQEGYVKLSIGFHKIDSSNINLEIKVVDSGIGISEQQQQLVFDPFHQELNSLNKIESGTGLGLTITKRLVEKMKGSISLTSQLGSGTIFFIVFRDVKILSDNNGFDSQNSKLNHVLTLGNNYQTLFPNIKFPEYKILLVDDIEYNRILIKEFLKKTGFIIFEVDSAGQALNILMDYQFDLILMDLKLPDIDGYELTKIIKSDVKFNNCPIIAFTASNKKYEDDAILDIFDGYLLKPVILKDLINEFIKFLPVINYQIPADDNGVDVQPIKQNGKVNDKSDQYMADLKHKPVQNDPEIIELIEFLENKIYPELLKALDIIIMEDISQIIDDMNNISHHHDIPQLSKYINDLTDYYLHYDINNINKTINQFPSLTKYLKSLINPE